ncbi:MAG TPA: hypothetical protein PLX17_05840 [Chitinophagaceae bacterium]|nr:hypothetical protein [Chitinophagaceae bacterium]
MNEVQNKANGLIDKLEVAMLNHEPIVCPVTHTFVPGMYIREIFMPKGKDGKDNWVTSRVHNTEHPYFIMKGRVAVYSENDGVQFLQAGDKGITRPNTRRVLLILDDCVWITCHPTDIVPENDSNEAKEAAAELVGEQILAKYENPLLGGHYVNNSFIPNQQLVTH